jgi:hypothetical protein
MRVFLLSFGHLHFFPRHKSLGHFKALEEIKSQLHPSCLLVRHSVRLMDMENWALSDFSSGVFHDAGYCPIQQT